MEKGISAAQEIITFPMPHPEGNYYFPKNNVKQLEIKILVK
jgi:phosphoribosylformylglycinamidine (FGAM) synthase-like amidotransferase family enzyme